MMPVTRYFCIFIN
ncbi:phage-related tail fiber -like domain protein, partial [Escherichia coli EC1736]